MFGRKKKTAKVAKTKVKATSTAYELAAYLGNPDGGGKRISLGVFKTESAAHTERNKVMSEGSYTRATAKGVIRTIPISRVFEWEILPITVDG